jgi:putative aldouronate transport system substrate-binding protein
MRKQIAALVLLAVVSGFAFAGGGAESDAAGAGSSFPAGEFVSYPLNTDQTLSYWRFAPFGGAMDSEDVGGTPYGRALAEKTGVTVEWLHPVEGQEQEQLNLLVASGDLPDIIEYNWLSQYSGGPEKAIQDGVILDLSDLAAAQAPHFWTYLQANLDVSKMARTDSGLLYSMPFVRGDARLMSFFGLVVNKALLDEVGLDLPVTMDDWYEMLTAFKDAGVASPLTFESWMLGSGTGSPFVGAYGIGWDFYLDDRGDVQFGPIRPEFRDFLAEFSRWYDEGLLDADIATVDRNIVLSKLTNRDAGAAMGYRGSRMGAWIAATEGLDGYDFTGIQYPTLEEGDTPMFSQLDFPVNGYGAAVSTMSSNPELALRFIDFNYSEEGHILNNFGVEGESFVWDDGYPKITDLILNNPSFAASQISQIYLRSSTSGPFVQDWRYTEQGGFQYPAQLEAMPRWTFSDMADHRMPLVTPTPEESEELAEIMTEVNTYKSEMFWKFVFGSEDLSSFDEYVSVIEDLGIARAIEIQEAALARYNAR